MNSTIPEYDYLPPAACETIIFTDEAEAVRMMYRLYGARSNAIAAGQQVPVIEGLLDLFWTVSMNGAKHNYSFRRWLKHVNKTMSVAAVPSVEAVQAAK